MRAEKLHPDYVTDSEGHKKAVILPIEEFNELLRSILMSTLTAPRPRDPNVDLARHFAESLGEKPEHPVSLKAMSVETRAEMLDRIDGPLIERWPSDEDTPFGLFAQIAKQLAKIADVTKDDLPDVPDSLVRINIVLRLWAGCLETAKTIALETKSGPNTPKIRSDSALHIDQVASIDPIYEAGVEAALAFKKRRGQPISFEGIPRETRVFKLKE